MSNGQYHLNLVLNCEDKDVASSVVKLFHARKGIHAVSDSGSISITQTNNFDLIMSTVTAISDYGQIIDLCINKIRT